MMHLSTEEHVMQFMHKVHTVRIGEWGSSEVGDCAHTSFYASLVENGGR